MTYRTPGVAGRILINTGINKDGPCLSAWRTSRRRYPGRVPRSISQVSAHTSMRRASLTSSSQSDKTCPEMDVGIDQSRNDGFSGRIDYGRVRRNRRGTFAAHALDLAARYSDDGIQNRRRSGSINQKTSAEQAPFDLSERVAAPDGSAPARQTQAPARPGPGLERNVFFALFKLLWRTPPSECIFQSEL